MRFNIFLGGISVQIFIPFIIFMEFIESLPTFDIAKAMVQQPLIFMSSDFKEKKIHCSH